MTVSPNFSRARSAAHCQMLQLFAVALFGITDAALSRRVAKLHSPTGLSGPSGLASVAFAQLRGANQGHRGNVSAADVQGVNMSESPCTRSARGVDASKPPTPRIREAGLLHFDKASHIDQTRSLGFDWCSTRTYKQVNTLHDPPKFFPDAMALEFVPGTFVTNRTFMTTLYDEKNPYCVAAIGFRNATWNQTDSFHYWAIGRGCCRKINETITFECGNISVSVPPPPPPPPVNLSNAIASAISSGGDGKVANSSAPVPEVIERADVAFGFLPSNKMFIERFTDTVAMAENLHGLTPITETGIKLVWVTNGPSEPNPDWIHPAGMKPPICNVTNVCVAPIVGDPKNVDPFELKPVGPTYFAVGRGCCSHDRLEPGFGCIPSPLAHSGVVLMAPGLRHEWTPAIKKLNDVYGVNADPDKVIFLWWDTPSTASWQCHRTYYPWLQAAEPQYSPPPKYLGCRTSTAVSCSIDADCAEKWQICHGALKECICAKGCWREDSKKCESWRTMR